MFLRLLLPIFTFALFSAQPLLAGERRKAVLKGPIAVVVLRVVDGDTFLARANVWLGQEITVLVRIRGIDAPELKAGCEQERAGAVAATKRLAALLSNSPIALSNISGEKYFGRVLADVSTANEMDPAAQLLKQALVRPYRGKKRLPWC